MSKNKETIADIVAEMRTRWAEAYHSERHKTLAGNDPENEFVSIDTEELADRIKAANFSECEALREERNRAGLIERAKYSERLRVLRDENERLRAALKNTVDVLNAVGPLVLKHDETCIITLGVGCAINNAKRALQESEAKE